MNQVGMIMSNKTGRLHYLEGELTEQSLLNLLRSHYRKYGQVPKAVALPPDAEVALPERVNRAKHDAPKKHLIIFDE